MGPGLEVEGRRGPGAPDLLVGLLIEPDRHALVSQIGKLEQALLELLFGGTHPLFLLGYVVRRPREFLAQPVGGILLPGPVERADLPVPRLERRPQLADRCLQPPPLFEQIQDSGEIPVVAAVAEALGGPLGVPPYPVGVEHRVLA